MTVGAVGMGLTVGLTTLTSVAQGQTSEAAKREKAIAAFKEAEAKFAAGAYADALPLYQTAEETIPGAKPKFQIAACLDKLGRTAEAVAAYRTFIDSNPDQTKHGDKITEAGKRIAALEAALPATVTVTVSPPDAQGVRIEVDGQPAEGNELSVAAGEHTIVVSADGKAPKTETVMVKANEKKTLEVALEPAATPAPAPPQGPTPDPGAAALEEEEPSNIPAYVTLGIAGAGLVVGTVFGVQALSAQSDFDEEPTTDNADRAERNALISDMSFGVALTFGITGAVLLISNLTGGDEEAASEEASLVPEVTPYGGPRGGGASAKWTF
ncbi:MAG: PEGA domain-containing protein [Myxococcota bacterium]